MPFSPCVLMHHVGSNDGAAEGLPPEDMEEWWDVGYVENPSRGCSYVFGWAAINRFLADNSLLALIRAHEVQDEGYYLHHMYRTVCAF